MANTTTLSSSYISEAEREGGVGDFSFTQCRRNAATPVCLVALSKGRELATPRWQRTLGGANHPVTLVTLHDAQAYAAWLGRDLPSEAEWEFAAKFANPTEHQEHEPRDQQGKPLANFWQGSFPQQNSQEDGHAGLAPVGCYPANAANLFDMIGNAWEQTRDVYTPSHQSPALLANDSPAQAMVVKGGSHLCGRDFCVRYRPSAREAHEANLPIAHIGFRTVQRQH